MKLTMIVCMLVAFPCCLATADEKAKAKGNESLPVATKKRDAESASDKPVKLDPKGDAHPPSIWMQQKLKYSQRIFAGMVEGDLVGIEESARHLKLLNRLENFVRSRQKGYRTQLRMFQYANDEILKGAKEKNLDRITIAYNQMTLSCVACHKQSRSSVTSGK